MDSEVAPQRAELQLVPYSRSWTVLLVAINTLVFILMCVLDQSLFLPSERILELFGAKNTARLFAGEYWRLITPIFVHIGLIHFSLNMLGLLFVGRHIERHLGGTWFLIMYLWTGFNSVLASFLFTFGQSAGASGAIFGIVGCGFVFERFLAKRLWQTRGIRLRRGPYTGLVVANVIIGFILTTGPIRIDNAAHLGGLSAGIFLGLSFLYLHANQFVAINRRRAMIIFAGLASLQMAGVALAISPQAYRQKVLYVGRNLWFSDQFRFEALSEGISVFLQDRVLYFERGKLLALDGQSKPAAEDLSVVAADEEGRVKLDQFLSELEASGHGAIATEIRASIEAIDIH